MLLFMVLYTVQEVMSQFVDLVTMCWPFSFIIIILLFSDIDLEQSENEKARLGGEWFLAYHTFDEVYG